MNANDFIRKYKNVYLIMIPGGGVFKYSFATTSGGRNKDRIEYLQPFVNSFEEAQIMADKYLEKPFVMCRWKKPCESIFQMILFYEMMSSEDREKHI